MPTAIPAPCYIKKTFEVYGKKSEGVVGDPDRGEVQSPIYCFDIELGEKLRIESAWFSVYAEDTGEKQGDGLRHRQRRHAEGRRHHLHGGGRLA